MNTIHEKLLERFGDYNVVNDFTLNADTDVRVNDVIDILFELFYRDSEIYERYKYLSDYRAYIAQIIETIGTAWNTKKGKFTKRLVKAFPMLEKYAGILGDQITRNAINLNTLQWKLSLSEEIFWADGNFGNSGSCWWGCYRDSRDVFLDEGGIALLWHTNNDPYNGHGRAWVMPLYHHGDALFIFNQYGNIRIEKTAQLITELIPDTKFTHIQLYNDANENIPYINGNAGMLITYKDNPVTHDDTITVEWGEPDNRYTCDQCGERVDEDNAIFYNGDAYCEDCFNDSYTYCDHCGEVEYRNDAVYIDAENVYYCDYCFRHYGSTCDECGENLLRVNAYDVDYNTYCETCYNDNFTSCDHCGDVINFSDAHSLKFNVYCETCYTDALVEK